MTSPPPNRPVQHGRDWRKVLAVVAIPVVVSMTLAASVALFFHDSAHSTPAIVVLLGFGGTQIAVLVGIARMEKIGSEIAKTRHDLKGDLHSTSLTVEAAAQELKAVARETNGNLERAIQTTGEEVRKAEREQWISLAEVQQVAERAAEAAAEVAARKTCEELERRRLTAPPPPRP